MSAQLMPELEAITLAIDLLQPLSPDARSRVLAWLDDYFKHHSDYEFSTALSSTPESVNTVNAMVAHDDIEISQAGVDEMYATTSVDENSNEDYEESFDSFEQFYDYIAPKTARQKVATTGWWLEFEEGQPSWRTFDITKALKNIGRPLRYLSTTITQEKKKDDPLIEQLSKDGDSAQAHGTFRLSEFGRAYVEGNLPEEYLSTTEESQYSVEETDDDASQSYGNDSAEAQGDRNVYDDYE